MNIWLSTVFDATKEFFINLGAPAFAAILLLYFVFKLFDKSWFSDLIKFSVGQKKRQLTKLDQFIESLDEDDALLGMLKQEKRRLNFEYLYRFRANANQMNNVENLYRNYGQEIPLPHIIKAMKYFSSKNDGANIFREFRWSDKVHNWFFNGVAFVVGVPSFLFMAVIYIDALLPSANLLTYKYESYQHLQAAILIMACVVTMVGGMIMSSLTWPYQYAKKIKERLNNEADKKSNILSSVMNDENMLFPEEVSTSQGMNWTKYASEIK